MHVQNLQLFHNPVIYYKHHSRNVRIAANLFFDHVKYQLVELGKFAA